MGTIQAKRFDEPDEVVSLPGVDGQVVVMGELYVGRFVHHIGWRWSEHMKSLVGTPNCQHHHQGVVLSGAILIAMGDGAQRTIRAGEVFDIPPGHDAWVVGDEDCVTLEFRGVRDWWRPRAGGERVMATLMFTDIVGSTALAAQMGDSAWKELLARHYDRVRDELDRYHGYEIKTTGDGFQALFDGTARAVRCAASICRVARLDGLETRAGVHSGEVERYPDTIQGVALHAAARIAALAAPGEVLFSAAVAAMLEGSDLLFIDAGEHELKGLAGRRRLYRLVGDRLSPAHEMGA